MAVQRSALSRATLGLLHRPLENGYCDVMDICSMCTISDHVVRDV